MAGVKLHGLCDEFWTWRMREWPEYASFCGDHQHDDRLNDHTEQAFTARKHVCEHYLADCENLVVSELNERDQITLKLLLRDLKMFISNIDHQSYVFPLNNMEGMHVDFPLLTSWMKFDSIEDYSKYMSRLRNLPKRIHEDQSMLQLGINKGLTFSIYSVDLVPRQIEELEGPGDQTSFYQPFTVSHQFGSNLDSMKAEAITLIETEILPAFKDLKQFMENEYIPACRSSPGVNSMMNGKLFYEQALKWHISTDMTPTQVHELGLAEIKRIKQEMMQVMEAVRFRGSFSEFLTDLSDNQSFYYSDEESLLAGYRDLSNKIRPLLSKLFRKIPDAPLSIEASSKPSAPAAYYLSGTLDGTRSGKFYVNATDLRDSPKYEMASLTLHEGEPGHHFQGVYAMEASDLPLFRRYIEDMYYSLAPTMFSIHTAYVEGWGLYCEYLGKELGLYEDPYSLFGHLSLEMLRACRLVIDTGLHAFGWSLDEAVRLLRENTTLSQMAALAECKRYCTWPGQACAYKVGQVKIQQLRTHAQEQLGELFSVCDFHEEVLRVGMAPLDILEEVIQMYINLKLASE